MDEPKTAQTPPDNLIGDALATARATLHDANGLVAPNASILQLLPSFEVYDLGVSGAEPSIGVTSGGNIFYVAYESVMRSTDGGRTWTKVSTDVSSPLSLDPMLWVDPDTDRVWVDQLYVGCSWMSWSDDEGGSWTTNPAACGTPANDHQKIVAATPRSDLPTVGYPKVAYYCYNGLEYSACSTSRTGGLTWNPAVPIYGPKQCEEQYSYVHGRIRAAPDGTVYVPKIQCGPQVAVSRDDGVTWEQHRIDTTLGHAINLVNNPDMAVDEAGNVYFAWGAGNALMYLSVSRDAGQTWSDPIQVSPPQVTSTLHPSVVAGSEGRIAIAYWASTNNTDGWESCQPVDPVFGGGCSKGPYAENAPDNATWHQWVTYAEDALVENPTFLSVQVTPDEDPLQIGSIHMGGGGDPDRNLLDFIDAAMDKDGRVYIATADGCLPDSGCKFNKPDTSRADRAVAGVLQTGMSLLENVGVLTAPPGTPP